MKALIVDDEPLARDSIRILLEKDSDINQIAVCSNGTEAVKHIAMQKPDLVFLDIQMPQINGLEVVEMLQNIYLPCFIFVTAYDEFALKAFELSALDYLLKPYTDARFYQSLAKAKQQILKDHIQQIHQNLEHLIALHQQKQFAQRLAIKNTGSIKLIDVNDIYYLQAADNYVEICEQNQKHLMHKTLTQLEQRLNPQQFVRIHRSVIVNIHFIKGLEPYFNGEYQVILKNDVKLKLSRSYKDKLAVLLGE